VVEIAGHRGKVIATSLLATSLRTPKNVEVTIPNATVMGAEVVNFSVMAREKRLILPTTANIGYTAPWRQVHAMLLQAAERTEGVLADPASFVLQKSLDSFGVTYELNVYVGEAERMQRIYSDLHKNIQDVFNEYGVEIMTPAYEGDRDEPTVVPKERWYAPPAKPPGTPGADV
jgi:small-conductance mechanosensitive channel